MQTSSRLAAWLPPFAVILLQAAALPMAANAQIYGTMSNFDVYNTTPEPCEGAEIELEGLHSSDVYNTFPSHYNTKTITEYVNGTTFGTRIRFEDYNFNTAVTMGSLWPNPHPVSTNGHALVNTDGGEHFGFAITQQPTVTRFYWLNKELSGDYTRVNADPLPIPNPAWTYVPPAGGGVGRVEARVELPEPAEVHVRKPDSVWMKVYKTELDRAVELHELMSGDDPDNIVPQDEVEVESEWELLEGGVGAEHGDDLDSENSKAVIRRYEFFKYTGAVDEENEPLSEFLNSDLAEPPAGELGDFIAANMVAANLVAPPTLSGDYDDDGVVDGNDFLIWQRELDVRGDSAADGNEDDRVDEDDLALWGDHFGGIRAGAAAAVAVPEPGAFAIVATAVIATVRRRRRRQG